MYEYVPLNSYMYLNRFTKNNQIIARNAFGNWVGYYNLK
jgi:hypothetical protein